ncbi:hypothetical protein J6590_031014 [Homalodisca vitripennis]|nr:hypothetical protein J6590_031014 [Homalodisca vitripennis]
MKLSLINVAFMQFVKEPRVILSVRSSGSVGLVVLLTAIFGHPYQRGFFCDDDSIRYPLVSETITTPQVAIASFVIPIPIVTWSRQPEASNLPRVDDHTCKSQASCLSTCLVGRLARGVDNLPSHHSKTVPATQPALH